MSIESWIRCRWLCPILILSASTVFSQNLGILFGTITDDSSGERLPGVTLLLEETMWVTTTDIEGRFNIPNIEPGIYFLQANIIGYKTYKLKVKISRGQETQLDFHLHPSPIHLSEVLVQSERSYSAASSRSVRTFDLEIRPSSTAQQMLQMAPGLIVAQHAGGGKAEQIFLRGFDADHGTDVAIDVDGLPVNMVSHGHGQGYADLHFMIPEVIERVDVFKGPYFAQYGNLATAGAVSFQTRDHLDNNEIRFTGGSFGTANYTMLYQLPMAEDGETVYFAGNFYRRNGPFDSPQNLQRFNVFSKVHTHLSERSTLTLDLGAFNSGWDASGQLPVRAIKSGQIGRWGAIDDLEGGTTGRHNLNLTFRSKGMNNSDFITQAYFSRYDFKLFSNFTFFLADPINGDMIEQVDDRQLFGFKSEYSFYHNLGSFLVRATLGGGMRGDDTNVGLWKNSARERDQSLVDSRILERNFSLWGREEVFLNSQWKLMLGLRADYFTFQVDDRLVGFSAHLPHASGYAHDRILSPKAALVYSPGRSIDFFFNAGKGFHSNDARNAVIDQRVDELQRSFNAQGRGPDELLVALDERNFDSGHIGTGTLPSALGAEFGLRLRSSSKLNFGAAAWWLDLDSEYVYIGDEGTTEEIGRSRRIGLDLEARLEILKWLWADADLNFSHGIIRDAPKDANEISLAPRLTSTGGLTARHQTGLEGALRYVHIGDRSANENGSVTAEGYTLFNVNASYLLGRFKIQAIIENIFDVKWNEAQFDTESRLREEDEAVSELHFTPGNPMGIRIGLGYFF